MLRRIFVLLTCCCVSLSACKTKPQSQTGQGQPGPLALGQAFQLKTGQTAKFAGDEANAALSVTFSSLLSESRCPADVQCAEAGEAVISVEVQAGSEPARNVSLSTMPMRSTAIVGSYNIQLEKLEPYPQSRNKAIPDQEYQATLQVTSIAGAPQAELNQPFQLKGGGTVLLASENLQIKFAAVTSDSRCPKSVTCVWSGEARVLLEVVKGSMPPVQFELSTLPDTSSFNAANYRFELQAVEPYPETPRQDFALEDYALTLLVRPLTP